MLYKSILLIDDDEDDQEFFSTALAQVSTSVSLRVVSNAREALDKLQTKEIETDLIFLDLNMPLMNGEQFLTEIKKREQLKNIPAIILSTSSHLATVEGIKKLGALDFITKPDRFEDLIRILEVIITDPGKTNFADNQNSTK